MQPERFVSTASPSEIAAQTFPTARRGFEPAAVRAFLEQLADELRRRRERERELLDRIAEAERRSAEPPQLDEPTLMAALGQETAKVLRSAHEAAKQVRERAEAEIAELLSEGRSQAERLTVEAEDHLARRTEEAEAAATQLRLASESEASAALELADQESEAIRSQGRLEAQNMVREAQELRSRVLGDLARRRRVLYAQVESLRAGRESLLDSLRVTRSNLDRIEEGLARAELEARNAAEQAARHVAAETGAPADSPEGAESSERGPETPGEAGPPQDSGPRTVGESSESAEEPHGDSPADGSGEAAPADEDSSPDQRMAQQVKEAGSPQDPPTVSLKMEEPAELPGDVPDEEMSPWGADSALGDDVEGVRIIGPSEGASTSQTNRAPALASDSLPAEPITTAQSLPEAPVAPTSAEGTQSPSDPAAVDALFARIRASRAEEVARARTGEIPAAVNRPGAFEGGADSLEGEDWAEGDGLEGPKSLDDPDDAALARRDEVLHPLLRSLIRRLKRALQDEQNALLDSLRNSGSSGADLLVSLPEQESRYKAAAAESLVRTWAAGTAHVRSGSARVTPEGRRVADKEASALAAALAGGLDRKIRTALEEESSIDRASARVGAAFREWKGQRLEQLVGDHVVSVFSAATLAATPAGVALRWVVDDEGGPCPDCDDNSLAGPTLPGDAFPTGQLHPPAHSGCRCLLESVPT